MRWLDKSGFQILLSFFEQTLKQNSKIEVELLSANAAVKSFGPNHFIQLSETWAKKQILKLLTSSTSLPQGLGTYYNLNVTSSEKSSLTMPSDNTPYALDPWFLLDSCDLLLILISFFVFFFLIFTISESYITAYLC